MRTHSEVRPYICEICGKGYKAHTSLTAHMRTHSGERPYGAWSAKETFPEAPFLFEVIFDGLGGCPWISYWGRGATEKHLPPCYCASFPNWKEQAHDLPKIIFSVYIAGASDPNMTEVRPLIANDSRNSADSKEIWITAPTAQFQRKLAPQRRELRKMGYALEMLWADTISFSTWHDFINLSHFPFSEIQI